MARSGEAFRINRVGGAKDGFMGTKSEVFVECFDRRGNLHNFTGFGRNAARALDYLTPGKWYALDFDKSPDPLYEGVLTGFNELAG